MVAAVVLGLPGEHIQSSYLPVDLTARQGLVTGITELVLACFTGLSIETREPEEAV
jgi:hypothetical protein